MATVLIMECQTVQVCTIALKQRQLACPHTEANKVANTGSAMLAFGDSSISHIHCTIHSPLMAWGVNGNGMEL